MVLVVKIGNEPAARPQTGLQLGRHRLRGDRQRQPHPLRASSSRATTATPSGRSAPAGSRTSTCSGRSTHRCSRGAAATPPSLARSTASDLINIGPNHASVYFRSNQTARRRATCTRTPTELRSFAPFGAPAAAAAVPLPRSGRRRRREPEPRRRRHTWTPSTCSGRGTRTTGLYVREMEGRPHNDAASTDRSRRTTSWCWRWSTRRGSRTAPTRRASRSAAARRSSSPVGNYIHGYWERVDRTRAVPARTRTTNVPILLSQGRTFIELPARRQHDPARDLLIRR